jgi:HlyD family secretion protein
VENEVGEGKKRFTKKTLIIIGVIVIIGLIIGLNVYRSGQKAGIKVDSQEVKEIKLVETVLASGKVSAPDKEVIYSQVNASVKKIHVKLGQEVKAGQILMELDIPNAESKVMQAQSALDDAQARLIKAQAGGKSVELIEAEASFARARNNYQQAQDKVQRNESLFAQGAISREQLEGFKTELINSESEYRRAEAVLKSNQTGSGSSVRALESAVAAARSSLELARREANQSKLTATMDGRVLSLNVENGDMVIPNTALITIADLSSLQATADIAEADAAKIKLGQKVTISSSALSDVNYSGKVQEIGLEARTKTKNQGETTAVPVIISIQKNSQLRPGYNVDLKITTAILDKAVVVPYDAIIEKGGHSCVYLIQDGKAKLQRIQTGISDNSSIQVKSGVKKGDKVIINPPKEVKDGSEVQAK